MTEVLVLCYHAVSPTWTATLSVTPDALERQLSLLVRRGWRGATFSEAVLDPPSQRTLAVTFDDAFASVRSLAEPILSKLELPATVFAPTAFMSNRQCLQWDGIEHWQQTPAAHEVTGMDWNDLAELVDRGWEVGSHAHTHPRLPGLDDQALRFELETSSEACRESLRRPCRSIAYPYGDVDRRVVQSAREAGYVTGAALLSPLKRAPMCWPRVGVWHNNSDRRFGLKINPVLRRWRDSRFWP